MSCNCNSTGPITSWIDWQNQAPQDPLDLIARAKLGGTVGIYVNSTTFSSPSGSSYPTAFALNGDPTCSALGSDNLQNVANANQWNFQHITRNSSATLAPPLSKVIFLRGGTDWEMAIPLDLGAGTYLNIQLSFRDNAGTRGDFAGTVPVIEFAGTFTGSQTLSITLKRFGHVWMGLRGLDNTSKWSMYESEWIIVP
ncbi:MAG: hypothetical protein JST22_19220 [Bacteroidetes bacterium]|nr:hypothetical protein [Bacteroidota bacterium]